MSAHQGPHNRPAAPYTAEADGENRSTGKRRIGRRCWTFAWWPWFQAEESLAGRRSCAWPLRVASCCCRTATAWPLPAPPAPPAAQRDQDADDRDDTSNSAKVKPIHRGGGLAALAPPHAPRESQPRNARSNAVPRTGRGQTEAPCHRFCLMS